MPGKYTKTVKRTSDRKSSGTSSAIVTKKTVIKEKKGNITPRQ